MRMLKATLSMLAFCFGVGASQASLAEEPLVMLKNISDNVIRELHENKSKLHTSSGIPNKIVYRYLLPHVDVDGMSRTVIGRNTWVSAKPEQKAKFIKEFTYLVVNTYSGALKDYSDETVQFYPLRTGAESENYVSVKSTIIRSKGRDIPMAYSLVRKADGWKIYDMSVEGVSLLQSFRSQFESQLRTVGFDSVINDLAKQNTKIRQS